MNLHMKLYQTIFKDNIDVFLYPVDRRYPILDNISNVQFSYEHTACMLLYIDRQDSMIFHLIFSLCQSSRRCLNRETAFTPPAIFPGENFN